MSTKLIRRALIASALFIGAAVAFSPTAFAEDITISGSVTEASSIDEGTTTGATGLDLDSTDTAKVATGMSFTTNHNTGATLTVAVFTELTDAVSGESIPTYVELADINASASGDFTSDSDTATINVPGTVSKDVLVRYVPGTNQAAGSYTGLITLTLADNV